MEERRGGVWGWSNWVERGRGGGGMHRTRETVPHRGAPRTCRCSTGVGDTARAAVPAGERPHGGRGTPHPWPPTVTAAEPGHHDAALVRSRRPPTPPPFPTCFPSALGPPACLAAVSLSCSLPHAGHSDVLFLTSSRLIFPPSVRVSPLPAFLPPSSPAPAPPHPQVPTGSTVWKRAGGGAPRPPLLVRLPVCVPRWPRRCGGRLFCCPHGPGGGGGGARRVIEARVAMGGPPGCGGPELRAVGGWVWGVGVDGGSQRRGGRPLSSPIHPLVAGAPTTARPKGRTPR